MAFNDRGGEYGHDVCGKYKYNNQIKLQLNHVQNLRSGNWDIQAAT